METLQGLSASELSSIDGRKWRTAYSDPDNTKREGLDSTVSVSYTHLHSIPRPGE